ncbi:MAG: hypothetical protein GY755_15560 [Chloroflexi bacterium]|nr:hypothetical protein [Chloroflexota bacterium]
MPALVYIGHQFRLRSPEPSDLNFIHGSDVSSDGSGSDNHSPHSTEIEFIGSDVSSGGSGGGDDDKCM